MLATLEAKTPCNDILQALNINNCQVRTLYPISYFLIFPDEHKLKQFMIKQLALQKPLKDSIQRKEKDSLVYEPKELRSNSLCMTQEISKPLVLTGGKKLPIIQTARTTAQPTIGNSKPLSIITLKAITSTDHQK